MRILLLVRSLEIGGAERQAVVLANALRRRGHDLVLVTFYAGGALSSELEGVERLQLGKSGRWDLIRAWWRLRRLIRSFRPDVLYTWMPAENLLGVLAGLPIRRFKRVWAIQAAGLNLDLYDRTTRILYSTEARLGRLADAVIANSSAGARWAIRNGTPADRVHVVPNGVDCGRFRPMPEAGLEMRRRWGVPEGVPLIGMVGRLDPIKDFPTFVRSAALLAKRIPSARFVGIGTASEEAREALESLARKEGLEGRFSWLGPIREMPAAYNALNAMVLSSLSEGLPNVIIEALACGIPCVATDVGDCRDLIADSRFVVPTENPEAMSRSIELALEAGRDPRYGAKLAARIGDSLSFEKLAVRTENVLTDLLDTASGEGSTRRRRR